MGSWEKHKENISVMGIYKLLLVRMKNFVEVHKRYSTIISRGALVLKAL